MYSSVRKDTIKEVDKRTYHTNDEISTLDMNEESGQNASVDNEGYVASKSLTMLEIG